MRWGLCFMRRVRGEISVEAAREIVEKLPESVEKVGVFVNHSAVQVAEISDQVRLSAVQSLSAGL